MMENIQINGQKIWGPPKDWAGPPPPHGTEVFIKNIPDDVFENELFYLFSKVGRIYEVRLPVHWNGINKGYAFVRFTRITEADAAIKNFNRCTIRPGRQIKVERSLDNTRLFLSSVPNDKNGEEIKSDLLTVVENVKAVYVYPGLENSSLFRGYAFVEFVSHRDAAIAKRILTPDVLFNLFERKCIAAWANPLPFLNKETLKNINILFMRNIPSSTKSISIRIKVDSLMSPDSVSKVKRLNDYAFLTFKNHDLAEKAMIKIKCNSFFLGPKPVHVEWAIPKELASSFSAKSLDFEKDDESDLSFEPKLESGQPLLKILQDYEMDNSKFKMEDYINTNYLNINNIENNPFESLSNHPDIRILQGPSKNYLRNTDIYVNYSKAKSNIQNILRQIDGNKPNAFSSFKSDFSSKSITNENQIWSSESQSQYLEDYYRDLHLKTWLQSLALTDQFAPSASWTTVTSPSTESSTNLSWKWEENHSQFSVGSGMSLDYDAKDCKMGGSSKSFAEFPLF